MAACDHVVCRWSGRPSRQSAGRLIKSAMTARPDPALSNAGVRNPTQPSGLTGQLLAVFAAKRAAQGFPGANHAFCPRESLSIGFANNSPPVVLTFRHLE